MWHLPLTAAGRDSGWARVSLLRHVLATFLLNKSKSHSSTQVLREVAHWSSQCVHHEGFICRLNVDKWWCKLVSRGYSTKTIHLQIRIDLISKKTIWPLGGRALETLDHQAEWLQSVLKLQPGTDWTKDIWPTTHGKTVCILPIFRFLWRHSRHLNSPFTSDTFAYDHTTLRAPHLVRSGKLSNVGPG